MKYIKTLEDFINESKIIKTETITHEIDVNIDRQFISDGGWKSEQDMAETISSDVSLKSGSIDFESDYFEIKGITMAGNKLEVSQSGEFDMYGGPYDPKLKKPTVKLNDKDIYSQVKREFDKDGWDSKEVDMSRTDIWGSIIK